MLNEFGDKIPLTQEEEREEHREAGILNKYKPVCIFNLAAETHVDRSIDDAKSFIYSNILGVYNILECFKKYSQKNKKTSRQTTTSS